MGKNGAKGVGGGNGRWEKNLAALKARPPGLDLIPGLPSFPPDLHKVKFLAGEHPSIRVTGEEGRGITLHSTRRALEEALDLAQTAPLGKSRHLVTLGLGLGYHLLALLPYLDEDQHLILVEHEPEVLWAALASLDLTSLFSRPRTMLVVSPEAAEAVRHLQARLSGDDDGLAFWGHPPSLRCQKSYYQEVVSRLRPAGAAAVRPVGLNRENLKILLINPDYFLIPEVMRAFRQLGHQVHLALFDKRRDQSEEVLQRLLANIVDYAPDLVFTVNHLGFDREGILLNTLHRLRVPSVSWYVDSPAIILSLYDGPQSDLAFIFVWDPTYIPEVRALGFERVFPLPLATDPEVFSPERARSSRRPQEVTFVGNSLAGSVEQKLARLPRHQEFKELFEEASRATDLHPGRCLDALLIPENLREHPLICGLNRQELTDFKAALLWRATLKYRLACVKELAPFTAGDLWRLRVAGSGGQEISTAAGGQLLRRTPPGLRGFGHQFQCHQPADEGGHQPADV